MKKTMKISKYIILLMLLSFLYIPAFAAVNSVTIISMTPPNPNPGDMVAVQFSYCCAAYENSHLMLAISTSQTFLPNNTAGQQFKVDENGIDVNGTGMGNTSAGGGYIMNDNSGGSGPYCNTVTWNVHIPSTLAPGPYNIVVGGKAYYTDPGQVDSQSYIAFSLPLPTGSAAINETVENNTAQQGDEVLYTINYSFVNSNTFVITDVVPPNCTLISQSNGGTNTGTTPGSTLTWNVGSATTVQTGSVWFIVQINSSITPIDNAASWTAIATDTGLPISGSSSDAPVTVSPAIVLTKSENVTTAVIGDTISYAFNFDCGGLAFNSLDSFDTDAEPGLFTAVSNQGPGYPGTWTWQSDGAGGGYIYSPSQGSGPSNDHYPHYLRNTPTDFCFGEIQADILILNGSTNWDALISFRDNGVPDAIMSYGVGISQDNNPGYIYIQKSVPAYTPLTSASPYQPSFNTWYTVKILVTDPGNGGVMIQAKFWQRGTGEPGAWQVSWLDNSGVIPACGKVGFQGAPFNPDEFDGLKILKSNASNARVYDTVPTIITYVGGTAADTTHDGPVYSGGMVSWHLDSPMTDTAYSLTWWGTVNDCGMGVTNQASYDADDIPQIDSNIVSLDVPICKQTPTITPTYTDSPTPLPPTATFTPTFTMTYTRTATPTVTITPTPLLPVMELTKFATPVPVNAGDTVTYTINYRNTGNANASNYIITDVLDNNLTFVSCSSGCVPPGAGPGGQITWNLGTVVSGSPWNAVTFSAIVSSNVAKGTIIPNTAHSTTTETGLTDFPSNTHQLNVSVPDLKLDLVTNYPNPAKDNTIVVFNLSVPAAIDIKFYTISGELVRTLTNDDIKKYYLVGQADFQRGLNRVDWNLENDHDQKVASGIYFYKIEAKTAANEKAYKIGRMAIMR
jgi:uncharacterized repeat protein (TIGR01451 family)